MTDLRAEYERLAALFAKATGAERARLLPLKVVAFDKWYQADRAAKKNPPRELPTPQPIIERLNLDADIERFKRAVVANAEADAMAQVCQAPVEESDDAQPLPEEECEPSSSATRPEEPITKPKRGRSNRRRESSDS